MVANSSDEKKGLDSYLSENGGITYGRRIPHRKGKHCSPCPDRNPHSGGLIIGWLGQRSDFCSLGGIRDFILFRQTRLLKGYVALIVSAFVFYLIFSLIVPSAIPKFFWCMQEGQLLTAIGGAPAVGTTGVIILMIIGGIFVGLIGTLLGGCPLRQLVMTSEGNLKSLVFVIGMLAGAVIFTALVSPWLIEVFKALGI